MTPLSRGFHGRRRTDADAARVPPGQYVTGDFPVLSAGPTPHTPLESWTFTIRGALDEPLSWSRDELQALPSETVTAAEYVLAFSDGGYTTNLPLEDLRDGKAWVAYGYDGEPLEPQHGGPARLLVPHLYFWKSAKWLRGLELREDDEPGFWETYGYHDYGDPWKEQRYAGD